MSRLVLRPRVPDIFVERAIEMTTINLGVRMAKHGPGAYASPHECFGVLWEEAMKELGDALHANDAEQFVKELSDVAVTAIFGIASIRYMMAKEKKEGEGGGIVLDAPDETA